MLGSATLEASDLLLGSLARVEQCIDRLGCHSLQLLASQIREERLDVLRLPLDLLCHTGAKAAR